MLADDGLPFGTLGYANGPGPAWIDEETGKRHNISKDDPDVPVYRTPVPVPLNSETHGGDDVRNEYLLVTIKLLLIHRLV